MPGRGELTDKVKQLSKKLLGYEIDVTELRLMPYVHYVMMNSQKIDPTHCNDDDRKILRKWKTAGYVKGSMSGMAITTEFWDIMNEILFLSYVAYRNED